MGPYQVLAIIAVCTLMFAAVVAFLSAQGIPLLVAFVSVYIIAIGTMLGMQRRARKLYDDSERRQG